MATRIINGRRALDRTGVGERLGAAPATIADWSARRAQTGFPEAIAPGWWPEDDIREFGRQHLAAKRATLTEVNRSGDPDELLTAPEAAKVMGLADHRSLPKNFTALADEVTTLPSGRKRRRWRRATVWARADARTGKHGSGPPPGSRNRSAVRAVDRTGPPDELVGSTEAARVLGYASNASLPARLYTLADETRTTRSGRTWHQWRRATLWAFADRM